MNTYVIITLLVIAGPLALSFDKRVAYYRNWKAVFLAMLPVSGIYIIWDILVTARGDWSFNPQYAGDFKIFGLPPGEWLFFITVPFACIFIYEVVRYYFRRRIIGAGEKQTPKAVTYTAAAALVLTVVFMFVFISNDYSFLTLLAFAVWIAVTLIWNPWLLRDSYTLWFMLLSQVAFLLVNGILTGLPIVEYNSEAIWNIRIITIPLEDLFYNISFLGLIQNVYVRIKGYGKEFR